MHPILATPALALARARQRNRWGTRTIERRERSYQQRDVQSGDLMQSHIVLAAFLFSLRCIGRWHCRQTHRLFYLFLLAVGVETSDKRDMHGLLHRIFAALKFDGAKFGESPTLTATGESVP
jgi:hypothetical protein